MVEGAGGDVATSRVHEMGPKRGRMKPPIRPTADGTGFVRAAAGDGATRGRGREGYPGSDANLSSPTASKPTRATCEEKSCPEMTLLLRTDSSLPSNEARLSPMTFKTLGIVSGAVLRIVSSKSEAYAEVFLSSSCHAKTVILADEVAAALVDKEVTVSVVMGPSTAMPLALLNVEITCDSPNGVSALQTAETMELPLMQIRATFRRQYQRRLVYRGMCATVRIATQSFYVEVTQCICHDPAVTDHKRQKQQEQHVMFGILMDGTTIRDGGHELHDERKDSKDGHDTLKNPITTQHLLVVGESGTGKSRFLQQEARDALTLHARHVETVFVERLSQGEFSDVSTSTVLRETFERAKSFAPSTIFIDDLHLICGADAGSAAGSLWAMMLVAAALGEELDDIWRRHLDVRVVASAPSTETVARSLLTPERFGRPLTLLSPGSEDERRACLSTCLKGRDVLDGVSDETLSCVARETHGFTQRDLAKLVDVAIVENFKTTGSATVSDASLLASKKLVRPSALKQFEVSVPQVTWDDIGGSEAAKRTLQDCAAWCLGKQQWVFRRFKLSPPKGVLLYGPPGCSKTMLAKALANESKMNFISVKGPEVFSKWVGDSEKAVRDIFMRARAVAPCVVFIDELDGMCAHRGRGGVSDRVISQFLTELDGLPSALHENSEALMFVAATNRPDNIDTAVLRPGRIDRKVYVGLPDLAERRAIVRIHFARIPVAPDLDVDYVASRTEGYSGAEVVAVIKEAAFLRLTSDAKAAHITREDVDASLEKVKPRINQSDVAWYKRWSMGNGPLTVC